MPGLRYGRLSRWPFALRVNEASGVEERRVLDQGLERGGTCHLLVSFAGGSGGAFPARCNRSASGAQSAARPGSRDGKPVRFGARRGKAPESVWNPGNDPPLNTSNHPPLPFPNTTAQPPQAVDTGTAWLGALPSFHDFGVSASSLWGSDSRWVESWRIASACRVVGKPSGVLRKGRVAETGGATQGSRMPDAQSATPPGHRQLIAIHRHLPQGADVADVLSPA